MKKFMRLLFYVFVPLFISSCASSTKEGEIGVKRRQLLLIPSEQIVAMSSQGYGQTKDEAKKNNTLDKNSQQVQRVQAIAKRITPQTGIFRQEAMNWPWEVHVITSPELNAYCMPGGKIMFYSG